jgi:hypothetical protein
MGTLILCKVFIRTPPFLRKPTKKGDAEMKNRQKRSAPHRYPEENCFFGVEKKLFGL